MTTNQQTALNSTEMFFQDGTVPEWVELIPAGQVVGRDGRAWNNHQPQGILDAFAALAMDLPVDLEHSTELKAPKGEPAPAAGWIKALEMRDGAIWGRVEWNPIGKDLVGSRQYRYLSPVILYQKDSGLIAGLTSVALTNRPNLNLQALNHQTGTMDPKENPMLQAVLAALGLPENATQEQALAKVGGLQSDLATAANRAENPSLTKFVPRSDYDAALTRATNAEQSLTAIKQEKLDGEIETAINGALKEGKITPATVDYHKAQCGQEGGLQRFADFCKAAPAIGEASGLDGKKPPEDGKALNADERTLCERLGITEDEYRKTVV